MHIACPLVHSQWNWQLYLSAIRFQGPSLHRAWIKGLVGIQPGKKYGSEKKNS